MKKLLLTLLAMFAVLATNAQSAYISNSRAEDMDCFEALDGHYGLLLVSSNKNLMVNSPTASKGFELIRPMGKTLKGCMNTK